jgi:hypothetical protein
MSFRRASLLLASAFVLVHSLLIYEHGISPRIWLDMREIVDVCAIVSICVALAGGSIWYVGVSMLLATVWMFPTASPIFQGIIHGAWSYTWNDRWVFSLIFLPPLSFATALLAEGRSRYLKRSPLSVE